MNHMEHEKLESKTIAPTFLELETVDLELQAQFRAKLYAYQTKVKVLLSYFNKTQR